MFLEVALINFHFYYILVVSRFMEIEKMTHVYSVQYFLSDECKSEGNFTNRIWTLYNYHGIWSTAKSKISLATDSMEWSILYRNATSQAIELILFHLKSKHYDYSKLHRSTLDGALFSVFFFLIFLNTYAPPKIAFTRTCRDNILTSNISLDWTQNRITYYSRV